jgi:hypothetical protein
MVIGAVQTVKHTLSTLNLAFQSTFVRLAVLVSTWEAKGPFYKQLFSVQSGGQRKRGSKIGQGIAWAKLVPVHFPGRTRGGIRWPAVLVRLLCCSKHVL